MKTVENVPSSQSARLEKKIDKSDKPQTKLGMSVYYQCYQLSNIFALNRESKTTKIPKIMNGLNFFDYVLVS